MKERLEHVYAWRVDQSMGPSNEDIGVAPTG